MTDFFGKGVVIRSEQDQDFSSLLENIKLQIFDILNFQEYFDDCQELFEEDGMFTSNEVFEELMDRWKNTISYTIFDPSYEEISKCRKGEEFIIFFSKNSAAFWEGIDIVPLNISNNSKIRQFEFSISGCS